MSSRNLRRFVSRFLDDLRRTPRRTKVLLVLVNAWLATCVAFVVCTGPEDEGATEIGPSPSPRREELAAAGTLGRHDWLEDFAGDLAVELREAMASPKVLAPAEAESFQRNDLPELALADLDEPVPETKRRPYVEPNFADWMVWTPGEAEGDVQENANSLAHLLNEPAEEKRPEKKAPPGRKTVDTRAARLSSPKSVSEEAAASDALLSPLPRTERRRLTPKSRRPMTREDFRAAAAVLATLMKTRAVTPRSPAFSRAPAEPDASCPASADRLAELRKLAPFDDPAVSRSTVFLAKDRDPRIRRGLVEILAGHDNIEAAGCLLFMIGLGDPVTELAASSALASLRDQQSVQWLYARALARGASGAIRAAVAESLGRIGEERAVPSLVKALRDVDGRVRANAALALGRLRVAEAAGALARLTRDRDGRARRAACLALGAIREASAGAPLVARLKDPDASVRSAAARALGALRSAGAVGPLIDALAREPSRVRDDIVRALTLTTGIRYDDRVSEWRRWWDTCAEGYEVPTLELAAAALEEMELRDVDYYGIRTRSTRIIFVVDVSGSMGGRQLERAKAELEKAIGAFTKRHFFNVIAFSSEVRSWKGRLVQAAGVWLAQAKGFVQGLGADGGTNIYRALMTALKDPHADTIFLLSDGSPTAGRITDPPAIRAAVQRVNAFRKVAIHCIGIGGHDKEFMQGLAEENEGRYVAVER